MYRVKLYMNRQQDVVKELVIVTDLFAKNEIDHLKFEEIVIPYMRDYFPLIVKKLNETKVQVNSAAMLKLGKKRLYMLSKCLERENIARLSDPKNGEFELLDDKQYIYK